MRLAVPEGIGLARRDGSAVIAVVNCGHTGRIGAYAEMAAGVVGRQGARAAHRLQRSHDYLRDAR